MHQLYKSTLAVIAAATLGVSPARAADKKAVKAGPQLLVNAVVASVDGKPITLRDLSQRLGSGRLLTLKEASLDPEANAVLDTLIMDALVSAEAESRKISVSNPEIEQYIEEVAKRNNLSREGFEKALVQEGKTLESYKEFVRIDILKSRLASNVMQTKAAVSDQEVDAYLKEHRDLSQEGAKIKLARILISETAHGQDGTQKRLAEIAEKLHAGADFTTLARDYSDAPDGAEGGVLGILAAKDLSSDIFEAVSNLGTGETSPPVHSSQGYQIFHVVESYGASSSTNEENDKLREEIRKRLQRQKLDEKMGSYFTAELMKAHSVDRKI